MPSALNDMALTKSSSMTTSALAQAWRDGELLVMRNGTTAPKRCVKCNAPAQEPPVPVKLQTGQMDQTNSYNMSRSDGMKAIDAISGIVDAANALSSIRRATVNVYVCEAHRPQRRNMVIACIILGVGITASIVCTVLAMRTEHATEFGCGGIAAFLISMFSAAPLLKLLLRPDRIEGGTVWLKGAGAAFVQSLEQWPGGN